MTPTAAEKSFSLLFVCTGNTCRSPMAAAYVKARCTAVGHAEVGVASAGIMANGWPVSEQAQRVLTAENIDLLSPDSRPVSSALVADADLIVTMTTTHRHVLEEEYPEYQGKIRTLFSFVGRDTEDVFDPVGGNYTHYRQCLELMRPALDEVVKTIIERVAHMREPQ